MNYYSHMQHIEHKRKEAEAGHRLHEQRSVILQAKKAIKMPFSLWRVIWAWFVVRRNAHSTDDAHTLFFRYLQPRKTKSE